MEAWIIKTFFFTFPFFHLVDESMFSCALIFPFRWVSLFLLFNSGHISLHQFWAGCHATQRHGWFLYVYGFEKQAMKWRFRASLIWMLSCFCKACELNNDEVINNCVGVMRRSRIFISFSLTIGIVLKIYIYVYIYIWIVKKWPQWW